MAEEKKEQAKFSITIIVTGAVVLLLLAGGIAFYVASTMSASKGHTAITEEAGVLHKIGDPKDGLIVNIGNRYVKTSIVLELRPTKNAENKESKGLNIEEVKMSDAVVKVLRAQKAEDFDAARQEGLKDKIKAEVNTVLGGDRVMRVYITNIVLQ